MTQNNTSVQRQDTQLFLKNSQCQHRRLIIHQDSANCQDCGVFISSTGQAGIKLPVSNKQGATHWNLSSLELLTNMKEEQSLSHFASVLNNQATYLTSRKNLVQTITTLSDRLNLAKLTSHHAVRYLDQVLSHIEFPKTRLKLVALCCSLIAAKFDELDDNIPLIRDYMRVMKYSFSFQAIQECEKFIISILDWNLKVTTPYHFLLIYIRQGILFESDMIKSEEKEIQDIISQSNKTQSSSNNISFERKSRKNKKNQKKKMSKQSSDNDKYIPVLRSNIEHGNQLQKLIKRVRKYAEYLIDLSLEDYKLSNQFKPSMIASSCVYAARQCNNVKPVWSSSLITITGYMEQDLKKTVQRMKSLFSDVFKFPESQKQQQIKKRKAIKQNCRLKLIACPKFVQEISQINQEKNYLKISKPTYHQSTNSVSTLDSMNQKLFCDVGSRQVSLNTSYSDSTNNASSDEQSSDNDGENNQIIEILTLQSPTLISSKISNSQNGKQCKDQNQSKGDGQQYHETKKSTNIQEQNVNILRVAKQIREQNGHLNKQNKCAMSEKNESCQDDFKDVKVKNALDWKPIIKLKPVQIVKQSQQNLKLNIHVTKMDGNISTTDKLKGLR